MNGPKARGRTKRLCENLHGSRKQETKEDTQTTKGTTRRKKQQVVQLESILYAPFTRKSELKKEVQRREEE